MTDAMMALRALLEKSPDADVVREMIGFAAEAGARSNPVPHQGQCRSALSEWQMASSRDRSVTDR